MITYGCSPITYGCSPDHLRLQPDQLRLQAEQAASSSCGNDENGVLQCDRLSDAQVPYVWRELVRYRA